MKKHVKGFTLIEVLIASFIMFIALATFSLVFRGAVLSSERAEVNVSTSAYTSLIVGKISSTLKLNHANSEMKGQGSLLGKRFSWVANVQDSSRPPARYIGNSLSQASHQAKIWQVELTVIVGSSERHFTYNEVTW